MQRRSLVVAAYWLCKATGLFHVARWLTRANLRIICYHGFALEDEDRFRQSLFVSRRFFAERMRHLHDRRYPVLPLDEAVDRLRAGTLPPNAVAITIDDGFYSVHAVAREILEAHRFSATVYLTSYYFQRGTPVFQLAISYICWKSPKAIVDLSDLGVPDLERARDLDFSEANREAVSRKVHSYGTSELDEAGRVALCRRLAERLDVDYDRIVESRILSLVSAPELRDLQESGMRIGLHTHRHRFPESARDALAEIEDNRAAVEPVIGRSMSAFCYPSGEWSRLHWGVLEGCGIRTATTCDSGLVGQDSHPFALPRILDDSRVSRIEFEAEMSGFCELLRRLQGRFGLQAVTATFTCEAASACFGPILS